MANQRVVGLLGGQVNEDIDDHLNDVLIQNVLVVKLRF
jgi:hypothetical protein